MCVALAAVPLRGGPDLRVRTHLTLMLIIGVYTGGLSAQSFQGGMRGTVGLRTA